MVCLLGSILTFGQVEPSEVKEKSSTERYSKLALIELRQYEYYEVKSALIQERLQELVKVDKALLSTTEYNTKLKSFGTAPDINSDYESYASWKREVVAFRENFISVEMLVKNL